MHKSNYFTILPLMIFFPIFISFNHTGDIGIDRVGGVLGPYEVSLPISFFVIIFLSLKYSVKFILSKSILFFGSFLFLCVVLNHLYNLSFNPSIVKVTLYMFYFYLSNILFDIYFNYNIRDVSQISKYENKYVFVPISILSIFTLLSLFVFNRGEIFYNFYIYNYEQYYAFIFVVFLGVLSRDKLWRLCVISILTFLVATDSANFAALTLLYLVGAFIVINRITGDKFIRLIGNALIISVTLFIIIYILSFTFISPSVYAEVLNYSITSRGSMVFGSEYYYKLFFPFIGESRGWGDDFHNEFLEVITATGIYGLIYYYYTIIRRLLLFSKNYYCVAISIASVVFLGGLIVENTMHPYMAVFLAYFISFYYTCSRKQLIH